MHTKSEMKKNQPKRQRIPRRGPGVAELEKILNEQQKAQDSDTQFQHIPPPPPPPPLPPRDYSSWSNLPLFPTLNLIPPPLPTAAAAAGPVFPTTPKSDTQMNLPPHFFPNFQFSSLNRQYCDSMVNLSPGSASSAARYFDQIVEHPSSQRSTDFNHIRTSPEEQEQMVNGKRGRSFLDENPNIESRRIPNFSNNNNIIMAVKDSSSSSSSSSFEINRTNIHFHSNFRDQTKRGFSGQLIMSSTKSSECYQIAEDRSNLMAVGSSSTPNQFAPFDNNFQETVEASQHRDEGGSSSDYNKVTFNSLYESNSKLKGGIVAKSIGSEAEATIEAEAEGDGIDLDLKL